MRGDGVHYRDNHPAWPKETSPGQWLLCVPGLSLFAIALHLITICIMTRRTGAPSWHLTCSARGGDGRGGEEGPNIHSQPLRCSIESVQLR
jgi:hypothetical protein